MRGWVYPSAIIIGILSHQAKASDPAPYRPLSDADKIAVTAAVLNTLKDPNSAIFKWQPVVGKKNFYCGLINSKNGFGGYAGDTPFMVHILIDRDGSIKISEVELFEDGRSDEVLGESICRDRGMDLRLAK